MIGQVFLTVLSGVVVFVVGQIFVKFVIEPINEFYKLTGEIEHSLIYYANVYSNTKLAPQETLEAHQLFRRLSCDLFAKMYAIPLFHVWAKLRFLPPREFVRQAGGNLIGLSKGVLDTSDRSYEANEKRRRAIEHQLRIETE